MDLTVEQHEGYTLAKISGVLDESARGPFREQLHPLVGNKGTRLILDLTGAPRISSPGIGNLVALTADANTNSSRVILCNMQPYVSMVIGVTKLDRFFTIVPDLPAAIERATAPEVE